MASSQSAPQSWLSDSGPPPGYLSRKALPIKKDDAQPLSRDDVQYDLLDFIFSDGRRVFTSPNRGKNKVNFRELYVDALYNSNKCSKVLRDKMLEIPAFSIELAKISLLTNVGRINTTMAFFPEMKTALRTYHPIPSLQKTDGNAQDAPRIKNCLKAALLPSELKGIPPSTPDEIIQKIHSSQIPSTSVVNLIFVLSNHATPLAGVHFDPPLTFHDFFLPNRLSAVDRARAFLWLIFHYLEGPDRENPFHDDYSRRNPRKIPMIRRLTEVEMATRNIDTPEEIEWGRTMSGERHAFLRKLMTSPEDTKKGRTREIVPASQVFAQEPEPDQRRRHTQNMPQQQSRRVEHQRQRQPVESDHRISRNASQPSNHSFPSSVGASSRVAFIHGPRPVQARTMLQQAWHVVTTTDPLLEVDEENSDEHWRLDYTRRLDVLRRLYGNTSGSEDLSRGLADRHP